LSGRPRRLHYCRTDGEEHINFGSDDFRHQRNNPRRVALSDPQNNLDLRVAFCAQPIENCLNARRRPRLGARSRVAYFLWKSWLLYNIAPSKRTAMDNSFASFIQLGLLIVRVVLDALVGLA